MTADTEYWAQIRAWIQGLIADGESDFSNLIRRLPGVDPILAVEILEHLYDANGTTTFLALLEEARKYGGSFASSSIPFAPHPLDFDWRFTNPTALDLVHRGIGYTLPKNISLLGTPSLIAVIQTLAPSSRVWLLDNNPLWGHVSGGGDDLVRFTRFDLTADDLGTEASKWADIVFLDAPWYPATERAYLWIAAGVVKRGGYILATAPPLGTRPSVLKERRQMHEFAVSLGLQCVQSLAGSIRYVTPPFEANAMRAAGISKELPDWRSGDLVVYQANQEIPAERPRDERKEIIWREIMIGGVRIKVRQKFTPPGLTDASPELESLVDGDILPSVSSRHPLREDVDVWTSGNRVFRCKNTDMLLQLCGSLGHNAKMISLDEFRSIQKIRDEDSSSAGHVLRQILAVVETETIEYLAGK